MSSLEKHTTSFEVSKLLEKMRFPQNTLHAWYNRQLGDQEGKTYDNFEVHGLNDIDVIHNRPLYAAPISSEIGELIPEGCEVTKKWGRFIPTNFGDGVSLEKFGMLLKSYKKKMSEADARAIYWMFLKKEGIIK